MSTTTTTYGLTKHAAGDTPWWNEVNANYDTLDGEIARPRLPFNSPTVGASTVCDLSLARTFVMTISQATTLSFTNVPSASFYVPIELVVSNGSAFAVTWPASVSWLGGIKPTFKAAGVDLVDLATKDAGVTWYASLRNLRPGVIYQNQALSTASTVDVSIASFSLPAGTLAVNGQMLRIKAAGTEGTQAGAFNIKFGATNLLATLAPAINERWEAECIVTRTGATAQNTNSHHASGLAGGTAPFVNTRVTAAETLANAITIDFRGSVTSGGLLTVDYLLIELLAVA